MSYAVLSCTGLDKPEGSVAREVAIILAEETGAQIICPVVLNRTPARYKKALTEKRLIVVDGCATQCATRLAVAAQAKPAQKVLVTDAVKKSGRALEPGLRLGTDALELARTIVDGIKASETGVPATTENAREAPPEAEFETPSDFAVVVHDKYEFRIPLTGYFFNANDVWVRVAGSQGPGRHLRLPAATAH